VLYFTPDEGTTLNPSRSLKLTLSTKHFKISRAYGLIRWLRLSLLRTSISRVMTIESVTIPGYISILAVEIILELGKHLEGYKDHIH
jgi:hypothetical protein